MVNSELGNHHLEHVSNHLNQTILVDKLLGNQFIDFDDIHNLYAGREVFEWLVFPNFRSYDYELLEQWGIPLIYSPL